MCLKNIPGDKGKFLERLPTLKSHPKMALDKDFTNINKHPFAFLISATQAKHLWQIRHKAVLFQLVGCEAQVLRESLL